MRLPALAIVVAISAGPADAHPHVWIDAQLELALDGRRLHSIAVVWRFDELFSRFVETEFDRDGDRRFSTEETSLIEREAFAAVAELGFLTHLRVDGELRPLRSYRDFSASLDGSSLSYRFTLPVTPPVEIGTGRPMIALYDETYYIDIGLAESDPVRLHPAGGCGFSIGHDSVHPIYFGLVEPIAVTLTCPGS
jgi:ABC-type uncharacterized transport system substrate-binding protein